MRSLCLSPFGGRRAPFTPPPPRRLPLCPVRAVVPTLHADTTTHRLSSPGLFTPSSPRATPHLCHVCSPSSTGRPSSPSMAGSISAPSKELAILFSKS
ncbi:hypothetical protein SORBI_3006G017332 [Sorghum bicolor]|uniref:Uncharacterized protein n=1 Tax=Sorghum bicolor TaxID=4558 RepID=A0A1Z5RCP1_SORBI|nr:hypothetical protein SORBI_3006G017332 [Sorghum bicolor]